MGEGLLNVSSVRLWDIKKVSAQWIPSTLWCDHCKTRKHNTYRACPKNKNRKQPKETPKDKKDPKNPKFQPRKGGQARTVWSWPPS